MAYLSISHLLDAIRRTLAPLTFQKSPSREAVFWAYRLLLGREPSRKEVKRGTECGSLDNLVRLALARPEFQARGLIQPPLMWHNSPRLSVQLQIDAFTAEAFLAQVSAAWERLGKERPHWSVLAQDQFLPDNMPEQLRDFHDSAGHDLEIILASLRRVGRDPREFDVCFEYGCGLGRVTSYLYKHFNRIIACDISMPHLDIARQVLAGCGATNVEFVHATGNTFGMSQPFDLWFSRIVLQHNAPPLIAMIIKRALSLLRPRGVAIFQVPTYADGYRFDVDEYGARPPSSQAFEMHLLPQPAVFEIAHRAKCMVLEVREDESAGPGWMSNFFTFQKL